MLVVASDIHRRHDNVELSGGRLVSSSEGPIRADIIDEAVRAAGHQVVPPAVLDRELLTRVHTGEYVDFLSTAWVRWQQRPNAAAAAMPFAWPSRGIDPVRPLDLVGQLGYHSFAADCSIVAGTWPAVHEAAAIAATATDLVVEGARVSYGLCRPPGHHATADQFGGYCYLNNSAIAAQAAVDGGCKRVCVLDVDFHHGNGTQDIFYDREDVLTVSLHGDPRTSFPYFLGYADETGEGDGEGTNLNLPMPAGTDFATWSQSLHAALDRIGEHGSELVVVALGVDTFEGDPISSFAIKTPDYLEMGRRIAGLGLPTVFVMEGGYDVGPIGENVANVLEGFAQF